jgi:hypothetical protein
MRVPAGSSDELTFTMEIYPRLPASAGVVKLYSCNSQGVIGQSKVELLDNGAGGNGDAAAGDDVFSGKLTVQGSSSNALQYYTVVVGPRDVELAPGTDVSNSTDTIVSVSTFEGGLLCRALFCLMMLGRCHQHNMATSTSRTAATLE